MARKLADESRRGDDQAGDVPDGRPGRGSFGRRAYFRLATTAVAGMTSLSSAVSASRTAGDADAPQHCLLIRGNGDVSAYQLTVDGDLVPGNDGEADAGARISGCSAEGIIEDGDRSYRFSGEIRDLNVDGDAAVAVERGAGDRGPK